MPVLAHSVDLEVLFPEARRDIGVLAVTSADRLNAGWTAAQRARSRGNETAQSHIEALLDPLPAHTKLITLIDGHPVTLSWLGSVMGHKTIPLGVEHFGQTGAIGDLYRHHGLDAEAIVRKGKRFDSREGRKCQKDSLTGSSSFSRTLRAPYGAQLTIAAIRDETAANFR